VRSVGATRDSFDDGSGIPYLRFTDAARSEFEAFRYTFEPRTRSDELCPHLRAHLSKFRGLIPRLALIYHLASGADGDVGLEAVLAALSWAEYLEKHAQRAYASARAANTDVAAAILRRIRKGDLHNGFTDRDVYRNNWSGLSDRDEIGSALKLLEDYDWLASERLPTGGRPKVLWYINPAVAAA
jgi:hypothetical protein